ncbi:MAG: S41 family peptidase, partial [Planctomycetota bacterium]
KRMILVDSGEYDTFEGLRWSHDSQWLAYVSYAENLYAQIKTYQLETGQKNFVTSNRVDSYNPVWSPDGKWLYFLSDRFFQSVVTSPWGPRQPEPFFDKTTKMYAVALKKEERFPFLPPDELHEEKKEEEKKDEKEDKKDATPPKIHIDWDGITQRIYEVPIPAGRYLELQVTSKMLFWTEREIGIDPQKTLMSLEIQNKEFKAKAVVKEIKGYDLSADGKKIWVQKENTFYVFNADQKPEELEKYKVELKNWMFSIQPYEEWRQIFIEAWRLERDYFYDPKLHGLKWKEILAKYLPLVSRVSDRDELADLIAQMVSELSALHIFVTGGDRRRGEEDIIPASLGAILTKETEAGGYRIQHIYRSEPDYLETISPLARAGIQLQEGDILEAINGVSVLTVPHPSVLLRNQVNKQVLLKVKSKASQESSYTIVKPISPKEERNLRYSEWELTQRLYVEEKGQGEIGYVHLRAMGGDSYTEWIRHFYPVFHRQGLIIDVRHNQGGNTDSWILGKLLRKAWFYWKPRVGKPFWNMQYAFRGHLVVLCNEWTASDGEAFAEGVRRLNLGKVIGTRTWGGEIWLSFNNWLVDKGIASAAEIGVYGPEGKWLIEGHGVDPDIVVDNLPCATFQGKDAQLETALHYLQIKIKEEPLPVPQHPEYPNKSK